MSLKFALPLALATICLPFVGTSQAVAYLETGDAGDLPTSAQMVTLPVAYSLSATATTTQINGSLLLTNQTSDSDMFQFVLTDLSVFTASTNLGFIPGSNNFDSQLALFTVAGVGIAANDDAASGGSQSTLTVTLAPGTYELLISGSGRFPVDANGNLIFANFTDGTTDPSSTVTAKSANPIAGYTGSSSEGGNYRIALSATLPPPVPEPSSLAAIATGLGGLIMVLRRRRA